MSGIVLVALIAGIIGWILVVRRLTARSWESRVRVSDAAGAGDVGHIGTAPARIGLWIFLGVITSLFGLFMSAYSMRMHHGHDWAQTSEPSILWVNTALLVVASIALQLARGAIGKGDLSRVKNWLLVGGVFTLAFLGGQLLAWDQLSAAEHLQHGGPALAFFYLLTAVHGLHLVGGLVVWGKTLGRIAGGAELVDVHLSIELCSVYWHYLLLVWVALFGLLLYT